MPVLQAAFAPKRFWGGRPHLPVRSLRLVWAGAYPAPEVSATPSGEKEGKEDMARRKLTLEEQLRGVRAALRSKRTPPQLKEGLLRRAEALEKEIGQRSIKHS